MISISLALLFPIAENGQVPDLFTIRIFQAAITSDPGW